MGAVDSIPVVSQVKSAVQAIAGDTEGAEETQKRFLDTCPVVSQGKSLYHWCDGDDEAARETQRQFGKGMSDLVDEIPVVGHVKGSIHYACGDMEGGNKAMMSASSLGMIDGGMAEEIAGVIVGGAAVDRITTGMDELAVRVLGHRVGKATTQFRHVSTVKAGNYRARAVNTSEYFAFYDESDSETESDDESEIESESETDSDDEFENVNESDIEYVYVYEKESDGNESESEDECETESESEGESEDESENENESDDETAVYLITHNEAS